jgi:hypothetical protein
VVTVTGLARGEDLGVREQGGRVALAGEDMDTPGMKKRYLVGAAAAVMALATAGYMAGSGPEPPGPPAPLPTVQRSTTTPRPPQPARRQTRVYFPDCDAARAVDAVGFPRGSPGYRPALDRDRDGVACET